MDESHKSRIEDRRQIEHLVPVAFAFLLPYLSYTVILLLAVAAIVHALYVSPRLVRVTTRLEERERGFSSGKLFYALSVLVLLILFKDRIYIAASIWAILAVGDSLSNLIGRRVPRFRIPYNRQKTWAGFLAFWIFGGLAGWIVMYWNLPGEPPLGPVGLFGCVFLTAFLCGLAESLPTVLDDNLTVAWIGASSYSLLFAASGPPRWGETLPVALAVNALAALLARGLGWLSWRGSLLAAFFGIVVLTTVGTPGYAVLVAFLMMGSLTTKAGFRHKRELNLAQGSHGERGVSNVVANGAVPLALACFHPWIPGPLVPIVYSAAVATAAFDTVSTEIGQWLGRHPFNLLTLRRVPVGTQGAISVEGTCAGIAAALVISTVATWFQWIEPVQAGFVFAGAVAGNLFESLLASGFRYKVVHSDEAFNLFATLFGAMSAATLWRFFG